MKILAGILLSLMAVAILLVSTVSAEVNYDLAVTDPTGTVFKPKGGGTETVGGHDDIDITKLRSYKSGDEIILELTVVGNIMDNDSYDYDIRIDTNGDEEEDYTIEYENESAELYDEDTENWTEVNFTVNGGTLKINVPIDKLGEPTDFDIMSQTSEYTDNGYFDLSDWASRRQEKDDDSPGFGVIVVVIAGFVATGIYRRRR